MQIITLERSIWIDAPRERVWRAVTAPDEIAAWFAPGASFTQRDNLIFVLLEEAEVLVAIIEVTDPPRQLTTRNISNKSITTTYLLEEENGGTRFTVTEAGLESMSAYERKIYLEQNGAGWDQILENLKAFVMGDDTTNSMGL